MLINNLIIFTLLPRSYTSTNLVKYNSLLTIYQLMLNYTFVILIFEI